MFKHFAISRGEDTTVSCEWANIGFDFSICARSGSVGACGVVFHVPPAVTETGVPSVNFGMTEVPYYHMHCESLCVSGTLYRLLRQTYPLFIQNDSYIAQTLIWKKNITAQSANRRIRKLVHKSVECCYYPSKRFLVYGASLIAHIITALKNVTQTHTHTLYLHVGNNSVIFSSQITINCSTAHQDLWGTNTSPMNAGNEYRSPTQVSDFRNESLLLMLYGSNSSLTAIVTGPEGQTECG